MKILKLIGGFILDFIQTIVTALAIFVIIYLFFFQPHQVKGNSMHTTLTDSFDNGEYILTNKINYRFDKPERGDVVVFKAPQNEDYDYIKRVVGMPGETVKVFNGRVYINGLPLDESAYLPSTVNTSAGRFLKEGEEVTIPEGKYFVLGDNRAHSSDSRDWGYVTEENIVGKAWFVYWPPNKLGLVESK